MSYDTNVFHFIYNDAKYEKASSGGEISFHYQGGLGLDVNAENIFTDHILTLEEFPFKPDVVAVTSLSCLVLEQNKEKLLSFPDAMAYTIFRLDELTKKKEFDAFDNLVK